MGCDRCIARAAEAWPALPANSLMALVGPTTAIITKRT